MTDSHPQNYSDGGGPSSSSPPRSHHHPSSSSTSRPRQRLPLHHAHSNVETRHELLQLAAMELEAMRSPRTTKGVSGNNNNNNTSTALPQCCQGGASTISSISSSSSQSEEMERSFPTACLHLLCTLPNNNKCHDCQSSCDATWASVSYGITLCLQCSGKHRGLGVQTSFIKSLTLDSWKRREILCMLEGGNEQLGLFFDRHGMGGGSCSSGNNIIMEGVGGLDRYRTKAASFYRQHLLSHAKTVAGKGGLYEGREVSRKSSTPKQRQRKTNSNNNSSDKRKKKSKEHHHHHPHQATKRQLPTVSEKESVEQACGAVGA